MITDSELRALADGAPFIFIGTIARAAAPATPVFAASANTAIVAVEDVIRVPDGLTGLAGRAVTVALREPLGSGRYLFFADPLSVGAGIVVRERGHTDATAHSTRERVVNVREAGYLDWLAPYVARATLVALGTIVPPVTDLLDPVARPAGVPWAIATLTIEKVLKGDPALRSVVLVGPRYTSRHLPHAPPLHPNLHATFVMTDTLPPDAQEWLAKSPPPPGPVFFLEDTADIQPAGREAAITGLVVGPRGKSPP